jgi:hypothetical protein
MGRNPSNTADRAVLESLVHIKSTRLYNAHWISEDTILELMQLHSCNSDHIITSSCLRATFNVRSKYNYVNDLTNANPLCIYKREKRKIIDTKYKQVCYFYFSSDVNSIPPMDPNWYSKSVHDLSSFTICHSCHLNIHLQSFDQRVETHNKRHKTNRMSSVSTPTETTVNTVTNIGQICNETQQGDGQVSGSGNKSNSLSEQIRQHNKWDSPEALSLFVTGTRRGMKQRDKDKNKQIPNDIKNHVRTQIWLLQDAHLSPEGWKYDVDDKDRSNLCTSNDIYTLRLKSKYLATTIRLALQFYEHTDNFLNIVQKAITKIDEFEYDNDTDITPIVRAIHVSPEQRLSWSDCQYLE